MVDRRLQAVRVVVRPVPHRAKVARRDHLRQWWWGGVVGVGEAEEPLLGGVELALVEVAGAAQRGEGGQLVDQAAGGC